MAFFVKITFKLQLQCRYVGIRNNFLSIKCSSSAGTFLRKILRLSVFVFYVIILLLCDTLFQYSNSIPLTFHEYHIK